MPIYLYVKVDLSIYLYVKADISINLYLKVDISVHQYSFQSHLGLSCGLETLASPMDF